MLAFVGEFLSHPAALEYSGNTCSHNCCYCFENIRNKNRVAAFEATRRFIMDAKNRDTMEAVLFTDGQAICISNRTDPFSETNYRQTLSLLKLLVQYPNGLYIQTKTGTGLEEAVDILQSAGKKNVVFYITITTADDDISRRIEPGAPPASERIAWAKKLRAAGYHVDVAFNPFVKQWMTEDMCRDLIQEFKAADFQDDKKFVKYMVDMINSGE